MPDPRLTSAATLADVCLEATAVFVDVGVFDVKKTLSVRVGRSIPEPIRDLQVRSLSLERTTETIVIQLDAAR